MSALAERFWAKVEIIPFHECWEWTAAKDSWGYGHFGTHKNGTTKLFKAHRFSWALHNGAEIPKTKIVLHSCDNPGCVNPKHLRLGTSQENVDDMLRKGRQKLPGRAKVTHCKNGHEYTTENTYINKSAPRLNRHCRICSAAARAKYAEGKR